MLCITIQYCFTYFLTQIIPALVTGRFFSWLLCHLDILLSLWSWVFVCLFAAVTIAFLWAFSYFLSLQGAQGLLCVFPVPILNRPFLQGSGCFYERTVLETSISLLLGTVILWQNKEIYVCVQTSICTHIYKYFGTYSFGSVLRSTAVSSAWPHESL